MCLFMWLSLTDGIPQLSSLGRGRGPSLQQCLRSLQTATTDCLLASVSSHLCQPALLRMYSPMLALSQGHCTDLDRDSSFRRLMGVGDLCRQVESQPRALPETRQTPQATCPLLIPERNSGQGSRCGCQRPSFQATIGDRGCKCLRGGGEGQRTQRQQRKMQRNHVQQSTKIQETVSVPRIRVTFASLSHAVLQWVSATEGECCTEH